MSHVPLYDLPYSPVEMLNYLSFHVLFGGEMMNSVFLQQFTHMSVVKLLTLVSLKFHRSTHVLKNTS